MCERSTQARPSALLGESCVAIGKMKEEILNNQQQSWGGKGKSYCSLGQPSFLLPQHTQNRRTKAACGKLTVGLLWALIRLENFGCASSGHHYVVSIKDTLLNKLLILAIKTAIKPKSQSRNVVVAVNSRSFLGCTCCPYLPCDVCMRCTLSAGAVQIFTSFSLEEVIKNQYRRICRQVSISTLSLYRRDWILTNFPLILTVFLTSASRKDDRVDRVSTSCLTETSVGIWPQNFQRHGQNFGMSSKILTRRKKQKHYHNSPVRCN